MRTVATTVSKDILPPVHRVVQLVTDPPRLPLWLPGCSSAELPPPSGPMKKGARVKVHFGTRATTFEVVDFAEPYSFGWVEIGARTGCKMFFQLDFAGSLTAVTIKDVWDPPSLVALVRAKLRPRRFPAPRLDRTIQNLRLA